MAHGLRVYQPRESIQCPVRKHRRLSAEPAGRAGALCKPQRRLQDLLQRTVEHVGRKEGLLPRPGTITLTIIRSKLWHANCTTVACYFLLSSSSYLRLPTPFIVGVRTCSNLYYNPLITQL